MAKIFRMDGTEMKPQKPHLVTRRNPYVTSGPYHDGILLDAAQSTKEKYRIEMLLNPPEITQPNAPYTERIKVPWRMIRRIRDEFGSEYINVDGWISDSRSGHILDFETTPFVRIIYDAGQKWELLMNTSKPENRIAFELTFMRDDDLADLYRRHRTGEKIFKGDSIEMLLDVYRGWKLPIIGIKEITALHSLSTHNKKYIIFPVGERILDLKEEERYCIGRRPYFRLDGDGNFIEEKRLTLI